MNSKTYRDYFNIDPKYYSAVTADLIYSGKVSWKSFYPHETFVKLLEKTHAVLSGSEPRSLWVEGAYGTGKSHAALTVKSLLEASDDEIREYFDDYGLNKDLCQKIITDKNAGKLITIHRIGSGSIRSDQDLILAVQDSIMAALEAHGIENHGEASLRDAALKWFEKPANCEYFDKLISEEQYVWNFGGEKIDAVIEKLKSGTPAQVAKTMRDIITVAEDNGITALRLDIQGMATWIKNIIEENGLSAILFIWDEFTEFFQNNPNSLTGFQTLAEISLSHPFYFMIVSHESRSLFINSETAKKILDRFVPPIKIELPENMAFRLMAQAMKTTSDPVLKNEWDMYKADLNSELTSVRKSIQDSAKKNATLGAKTIISDEELQAIVPIHPYAALLLKHLSVAFSSNQRSMFDFIINNDPDSMAFKWFISTHGPLDDINLLTIDMLWNFFYGKGQNGLNDDVRVILDSYSLLDSEKLLPDERRVLKTVLLLQAITMRVGDVELLRPNEQNVDLAFGGTGWQIGKAKSIAEKLVNDGLLFKKPVGGGKSEYTVANSTGDTATINKIKEEVKKDTRTQELVVQADLMSAITLPAPIVGRFIVEAASTKNFTNVRNKVIEKHTENHFDALAMFAISDDEAAQIKSQITNVINDNALNIIYIDTSITPMGRDLLEQYVESMAFSRYYGKNDKHRAAEYQNQADKCLNEWKNRIADGAFMLYTKEHPSGVRMANLAELQEELSKINLGRYPCGLEQYSVIANMFNKGPLAQGAECGITQTLAGTFKSLNERTSLSKALEGAWGVEEYWKDPTKQGLTIVKIKLEVEKLIEKGFEQSTARACMSDIFEALEAAPYGLMPNNITAFVLGFVLKEYAGGNYFWSNGTNSEAMTTDKMKNMIANAINQTVSPGKNFRKEYIVAMSAHQRAFLTCTSTAFKIPASQCGSIESARDQIRVSMKKLSFPIWCVKYRLADVPHATDDVVLKSVIDDYCAIANTANGGRSSESELADEIGNNVVQHPSITQDLVNLLTDDNCHAGMLKYIEQFESGILQQLAAGIEDGGAYIDEVKKRFNADAANWVWNSETADDKIRDVILDYKIITETNKILPKCVTIADVVRGWNTKTNNIRIAYDAMKTSIGDLAVFLEELCIMKKTGELPDQKKKRFYDLLTTHREAFDRFYNNQLSRFKQVAASFLRDLEEEDISDIYNRFEPGQFTKSGTDYFTFVAARVEEYLKSQLKKKIKDLWAEKTGTKDPVAWSAEYKTPILCMFDDDNRGEAKKVFSIMTSVSLAENDANYALEYLQKADFYDRLKDSVERNRCFMERVVGDYSILIKDATKIREYILSHTTERVYDWMDNTAIRNRIKEYADMQYKTGGYERAMTKIDQMDSEGLRRYLKELIAGNLTVGIEILKNE